MIPVSVLTGFLGSGKTTLLGRLLRHPAFSRTAVIINEFGEIGLDHDLIDASDESFVELTTGCLCCTVRSDLVRTLDELLSRRKTGGVPPFERVVIETTGLADPAPILHALMTDPALAGQLMLGSVVTTVDAVNGADTLAEQPMAVKQVAVADRLVLTKRDLLAVEPEALRRHLHRLNPAAPLLGAIQGAVDPSLVLDGGLYEPAAKGPDVTRWLAAEAHGHGHAAHDHDAAVTSYAVIREHPIRAVALTLFLEALAEHAGADLLRMKGIVNVAESPDRPAVVHGMQHVFHLPSWLERWPSADRRSRLVFITRGIPKAWVERLLAMLDQEVAEASASS